MAGTVASCPVRMYTTVWCGYCQRLKAQMTREGITFEEIDIEHDPEAAAFVESVNDGNQTVPTLVFPDGSALTNPSIGQVKENQDSRKLEGKMLGNRRRPKKWYSRTFAAEAMKLGEIMAKEFGRRGTVVISENINDRSIK